MLYLKMKDGRLELARASPRKHMKRMFAWVFFIFTKILQGGGGWWWQGVMIHNDNWIFGPLSMMMMMMMKMTMIHNDNWIFGPLLMVRQMPDWEADERKLLSEFQPGVVTTRETPKCGSESWIIFDQNCGSYSSEF